MGGPLAARCGEGSRLRGQDSASCLYNLHRLLIYFSGKYMEVFFNDEASYLS